MKLNFEAPNPTPEEATGARFLKERLNLHASEEVGRAVDKTERLTEEKISQSPEYQIQAYLNRWQQLVDVADERVKERNISLLKKAFHREHVLTYEDLPESYFDLQRQIDAERGESFPEEVSDELRQESYEVLKADQVETLDAWIDELAHEDGYPAWAKYWALSSVLKLSDYNKETHTFGKRTKSTTNPFPDLNNEALAYAIDTVATLHTPELAEAELAIQQQRNIVKQAKRALRQTPDDPHLEDALERATETLEQLQTDYATLRPQNPIEAAADNPFAEEEKAVSDDEFNHILNSENFAKYYAFAIEHVVADVSELYKITDGEWRVFTQGSEATELTRTLQGKGTGWCTAGTVTAQNQLAAGDFHVYYSKNDLGENAIPRLAIRMQGGEIAEVRGVAHKQEVDPYISEAGILSEKMDEFGDTGEEYKEKDASMRQLTEIHRRHEANEQLTNEDLRFLYEIDQPIKSFGYTKDPRIAEMLDGRHVKDDLSTLLAVPREQISTTEEEALSGNIVYHYGDLDLRSLTSAEGLTLPQSVGGDLDLRSLTSAEGLTLPQSVGGGLYLRSLTSAEGLTLPQSVGGDLDLRSLTSAEGLTLPQSVGGGLYLSSLTSAEGLTLPQSVGGDLDLRSLTSAEGLTLPQSVGGYLDLSSLTSAEGLTLPQSVGGGLYLSSLTSAEGLTLPQSVGGDLDLRSLTSAEGLTLPQSVGGDLDLSSLTSADKETLRETFPHLVYKI